MENSPTVSLSSKENSSSGTGFSERSQEPDLQPVRTSPDVPEIYESENISTPTLTSEVPHNSRGEQAILFASMQGDEREMKESFAIDHSASSPHRQRSRSHTFNHAIQPPSSHAYVPSSSSTSENIYGQPSSGVQGPSLHYPSPTPPYNHMVGHVNQYTTAAQQNPISLTRSQPSFSFSHPYQHGLVPDNRMSQNMHGNYQPMLQPPQQAFPYPPRSPPLPHSFGPPSSPVYPGHPVSAQHMSSQSSPTGSVSSSYVGSPSFSLRYPTSITTATYGYPSSPVYPSHFTPAPIGQPYPRTPEAESQGAWYYLPHSNSSPSPHAGPPYPPYAVGYSNPTVERSYSAPRSSNPAGSPLMYPISPTYQFPSHYSDTQSLSDSPHTPGETPRRGSAIYVSGSFGSGRPHIGEKPLARRSYHPNPPAHRSEWVMWAGNVPSDANHDELWRYFNQLSEHREGEATGVLSIFLISRSNCAFVNYENETSLRDAIVHFNGKPLRPREARCPPLVCRVRRTDDDLTAGVGGQRGMGMHTKWVNEQKGKIRDTAGSDTTEMSSSDQPSVSSSSLANAMSNFSLSRKEDGKKKARPKHSSSSGSHASTNSSFLTRHFPKRFFILKSLTQEDLDISVNRGVWATQKHNEEILDQAFRTSHEVHLIFGVNKSGEFYGYARMASPIRHGESRVSWSFRPSGETPSSSRSPQSPQSSHDLSRTTHLFFSPGDRQVVENSPMPLDVGASPSGSPLVGHLRHTAPGLLGEGYHLPTLKTPSAKFSLDQARRFDDSRANSAAVDFELDPAAPVRAMRENQGPATSPESGLENSRALRIVDEEESAGSISGRRHNIPSIEEPKDDEAWGDSFKVEWICTERLSFHRTKHLRNPWNHDREVKVSRDGTELEPTVGQQLLDEWDKLCDPQIPSSPAASSKQGGAKRPAGPKISVP